MTKYGSRDGVLVVPGIAPSRTHPPALPRVHLPATPTGSARLGTLPHGHVRELNIVVGLISVDQLSLYGQISETGTMTELYNLLRIGRINNHSAFPGTK